MRLTRGNESIRCETVCSKIVYSVRIGPPQPTLQAVMSAAGWVLVLFPQGFPQTSTLTAVCNAEDQNCNCGIFLCTILVAHAWQHAGQWHIRNHWASHGDTQFSRGTTFLRGAKFSSALRPNGR